MVTQRLPPDNNEDFISGLTHGFIFGLAFMAGLHLLIKVVS